MHQALDIELTLRRPVRRLATRTRLDPWSLAVVGVAVVLSVGSAVYFYAFTDMLTMAGDMATHLNIARRVVDNLTPGLANLGGYWLPLLHFLEIPLIWHDGLWRSGLAGGIVSMTSYVLGGLLTFRLARLLLEDDGRALIAAAVFLTNPMLLYFQTAPMFEPLLITTFVAAVYYLARWVLRGQQIHDLVLCGLWTALATLVRHDNWMLLLAVPVIIYIVGRRLWWEDRGHREAVLSAYIPLAAQGMLIFILALNWLILGNPIYFFEPPFQDPNAVPPSEVVHIAHTKGHLIPSFIRYPLAVMHNTGHLLFVAFLIGLLLFVIRERGSNRALVAYALLLPFGFFFLVLFFMGNPPIMVPELIPFPKDFWNVRYGITALPAVAVFVASLARNRWLKLGISALIAAQAGLLILSGGFYPRHTPEVNGQLKMKAEDWAAIRWLRENARDGLILMSTLRTNRRVSGDTIILHSGFPHRRFITEATQHYWEDALRNPRALAQWIVVKEGPIAEVMKEYPQRFADFELVFELPDGTLQIYRNRYSVISGQ